MTEQTTTRVVEDTNQSRWKRFYGKKSNRWLFWGVIVALLAILVIPKIKTSLSDGDADAQVAAANQAKADGQTAGPLTLAQVEDRINKALAQDSINDAKKVVVTAPPPVQQGVGPLPVMDLSVFARTDTSRAINGWYQVPAADGRTAILYKVRFVEMVVLK